MPDAAGAGPVIIRPQDACSSPPPPSSPPSTPVCPPGCRYRHMARDRRSEHRSSMTARFAVIALIVLAAINVAASLMQSAYHAVRP